MNPRDNSCEIFNIDYEHMMTSAVSLNELIS